MKVHLTIPMFLLGACLALGFSYGMGKMSDAVAKFNKVEVIRSKGYAEKSFTSDRGYWLFTITVRQKELADAQRLLQSQADEARAHLAGLGAKTGQFEENAPSIDPIMKKNEKGLETNEIDHYRIIQSFEIRSTDVALIDRLSKGLGPLISKGIEARGAAPQYYCSGIEEHKKQLLADATRNGRERAEILANNGGGRLGRLVDASQGVFQITPPDSTEISDYGHFDTTSVQKVAKLVVTLEFTVEKP